GLPVGMVTALAFSPDGRHLALGGSSLRLYQLDGRQERRRLLHHSDVVGALAATPADPLALSGSRDGNLVLWDVAAGRAGPGRQDHPFARPASHLALTPDGQLAVACGSRDPASGAAHVTVWETTTGRVRTVLAGHNQPVNAVAIDPHGERVAAVSQGGVALVWNVASGEMVQRFPIPITNNVKDLAFLGGGAELLIASPEGLQASEAASGRNRHPARIPRGV